MSSQRRPMDDSIFGHVVVGVDGTEAGFEACRQAAVLAAPGAAVELVSVVHVGDALRTGMNAPRVVDELEREAEAALDEAERILGGRATRRSVNGFAAAALLREVDAVGATLLAIGSHGHHRATEILVGGVLGETLHRAPCSVLIARPPAEPERFPGSLVVGVDGSPQSARALAAAEELARRFGASLRAVTGLRDEKLDLAAVRAAAPSVIEIDEDPVDALTAAARHADLLLVGSRGLHGLRALGSVSERVAHQASSSVLVVRAGA